jgi:hypothetical protein
MEKINKTILYHLCCASVGSSLFASAPQEALAGFNASNFSAFGLSQRFFEEESQKWLQKIEDLRQWWPWTARHFSFLYMEDPEEAERQLAEYRADPGAAQLAEQGFLEAERQRQETLPEWRQNLKNICQLCPEIARYLRVLYLQNPEEAERQLTECLVNPEAAQLVEEKLSEEKCQRQEQRFTALRQWITGIILESEMQEIEALDDF